MDSLQSTLISLTGLRNISLLVVPALWVNSIAAHFYAVSLTRGRFTNSSPRDYLSSIQKKEKKTSTDLKFIRAEAAQQNGFENLPFAAAAFVAGIVAKVSRHEAAAEKSMLLLLLIAMTRRGLLSAHSLSIADQHPLVLSLSPPTLTASSRRAQLMGPPLLDLASGLQSPLHQHDVRVAM